MKKIMYLLYVIFFTLLSIITFFNYSNYCEMLPYEGLKEISVKQFRENYTNKEYIELLKKKMERFYLLINVFHNSNDSRYFGTVKYEQICGKII